nr:flap endonuclease GEN isoform X2 [Parasteatoda tepidariorum]XP_042897560.1 flap endonuclease GEN isoform X2 [Parasteatoda tepidariorum]XP_042897561.1 flap endonuclease GEN isoform X2 [Parasteatoda tepidariorum]
MGVQGLWNILSELAERKPLNYLSGKRIAVDLSGWVVQATQCKGLANSRNPHLRNLFFRVSRLLQDGAFPIFVLEGDMPALKKNAFKERNHHNSDKNKNSDNISRSTFDRTLSQCRDLLQILGVPCLKSCGEAEAFCAFLCLQGIVDGVITEDSDAFLYGADSVFREFTIDPTDPHVNLYSLSSAKNKLILSRRNLIGLALLLGCDYVKGVPGIGKDSALKLLHELQDCDLLKRFEEWKEKSESELFPGYNASLKKCSHCTRCDHLGTQKEHKKNGCKICDSKITCYLANKNNPCVCDWHKSEEVLLKRKTEIKIYNAVKNIPDFPSTEVIEEYLCYVDKIPSESDLDWKCPNLEAFQEKAFTLWNFTPENSSEKCLPVITAWHQFQLINLVPDKVPKLWIEPSKIIKERTVKGEDCIEVQWKRLYSDETTPDFGETYSTVEFVDRFSKAYPQVTDEFFNSLKQNKLKSSTKPRSKAKNDLQADDSLKVISISEPISVFPSNTNKAIVPQVLSTYEKLDNSECSFSELPLLERIKILTIDEERRDVASSEKQNNENILNMSKESNCLFPFNLETDSSAGIHSAEPEKHLLSDSNYGFTNQKTDLCLNFDDSDSFIETLNPKSEEMDITSKRSSILVNTSSSSLPSIPNMSQIYKQEIGKETLENSVSFLTHLITQGNNSLCLEFTDSEQSFSMILKEDTSHEQSHNISKKSICKKEILTPFSNKIVKSDKENIFPGNFSPVSNFEKSINVINNMSPKPLYSVKQSPFYKRYEKAKFSNCKSIVNSTPYDKFLCLKSALTPKLLETSNIIQSNDQLFEPLIFDSSLEESIY